MHRPGHIREKRCHKDGDGGDERRPSIVGLASGVEGFPKSSGDVDGGGAGGEVELVAVDLAQDFCYR